MLRYHLLLPSVSSGIPVCVYVSANCSITHVSFFVSVSGNRASAALQSAPNFDLRLHSLRTLSFDWVFECWSVPDFYSWFSEDCPDFWSFKDCSFYLLVVLTSPFCTSISFSGLYYYIPDLLRLSLSSHAALLCCLSVPNWASFLLRSFFSAYPIFSDQPVNRLVHPLIRLQLFKERFCRSKFKFSFSGTHNFPCG